MAAIMIPVAILIGYFQRMLREHWAYDWSGTETGKVSCAGAFVWAYRQYGISLYNGSNRLAREQVVRLIPIEQANIVPGMAAFKAHPPGESGYSLPSGYLPGGAHYNGDLNDYYHIGLVDEDTARVLNAQGSATGFVSSPISKGWTHVAYLKQVDYGKTIGGEVETMASATIYAENGKAVNLRTLPTTSATRIKQLKVGTPVEVIGYVDNDWAQVSAGGSTGYVMRQYIRGETSVPSVSAGQTAELHEIMDWLGRLEERVSALEGGHG